MHYPAQGGQSSLLDSACIKVVGQLSHICQPLCNIIQDFLFLAESMLKVILCEKKYSVIKLYVSSELFTPSIPMTDTCNVLKGIEHHF